MRPFLVAVAAALLLPTARAEAVLTQFNSIVVTGDYVAAGVGLRGQVTGTINIAGIPAGSSVVKAYLYWGYLENNPNPALANLTFGGTPIVGTQIGVGPDTCWGRNNSFAYRADVTALVPGNGAYVLTGVASGGNVLAQGASLVVIFSNAAQPTRTVFLYDGLTVLTFGNSSTVISGFTAVAPVSAKTTFVVGDGQGTGAPPTFTGSLGTLTLGIFSGADGMIWDTTTVNVTAQVGAGSSSVTATVNTGADCLMWVAQVFSVTTTGAVVPPPGTQPVAGGPEGSFSGSTGPAGTEGSFGLGGRSMISTTPALRGPFVESPSLIVYHVPPAQQSGDAGPGEALALTALSQFALALVVVAGLKARR